MLKTARKDRRIEIALTACVFAAMLLFFACAHKLAILDADDWTYIAQSRVAVPALRFWNPSRLLPEILMPYMSNLAVIVLMPLFGDYISALTFMHALVLSVFITIYVRSFYLLLEEKLRLGSLCCAALSVLFLMLHFWVYRTDNAENGYAFMASDLTCIYYYTIPTLLNSALLMYFARGGSTAVQIKNNRFKTGLMLLVLYFAVFSNLYSSIVLASYMGIRFLEDLVACAKKKGSFKALICENALCIYVLLLWIVSLIFEASGERGQSDAQVGFLTGISQAASMYLQMFTKMNKIFLLFCAGLIASAGVCALVNRHEKSPFFHVCIELGCCLVIVSVFLVLLSAKVSPDYILRTEVRLAVLFFFFAAVMLCGAYALRRIPAAEILVPLIILVAFSDIDSPLKTFGESNSLKLKPEIAMEIDRYLIEQAVEADKAGLSEAELHVLYFGEEPEWPHEVYLGDRLSAALYNHGIISRNITFTVVPDKEVNEMFGLHYGEE